MNFVKQRKMAVGVLCALVLGVGSTAFVMSAIPHSQNGIFSACYRNTGNAFVPKGNLRLIDFQSGERCTTQETQSDWQRGPIAYAHVEAAFTNETSYRLYPNQSTNINSVLNSVDYPNNNQYFACIDVNNSIFSLVKYAQVSAAQGGSAGVSIKGKSARENEIVSLFCPASTDVVVDTNNAQTDFYLTLY